METQREWLNEINYHFLDHWNALRLIKQLPDIDPLPKVVRVLTDDPADICGIELTIEVNGQMFSLPSHLGSKGEYLWNFAPRAPSPAIAVFANEFFAYFDSFLTYNDIDWDSWNCLAPDEADIG